MDLHFSFIVPVYNRPEEIRELLGSMALQTYSQPFEVVIIEDGSIQSSETVVAEFREHLNLSYYAKSNSGPGSSRNYGMERANGNYFIILDSDCILPESYLDKVNDSLQNQFVPCFGGPDAAHPSFNPLQKAIDYTMTSIWTTGGIRGRKKGVGKFQPRSFNMGISKEAFEATDGFGSIHPGEDPDLTFRLWKKGYDTKLIPEANVYHRRRLNWNKFFTQVYKFGMARPILNKWHPDTSRITYWFPAFFCIGLLASLVLLVFGIFWGMLLYAAYFLLIFMDSLRKYGNVLTAFYSLLAVCTQFFGYGYGFLKSSFWLTFSNRRPRELFPELFFKTN
ncbi:MAG: glycosyltransferase [Bacteroidota bacterium]